MNTNEKKEMLLKLADELINELDQDESLYLMAYFKGSESVEHKAFCDVKFVASALLFCCQDHGLAENEVDMLLRNMRYTYDKLIGGEFDEPDTDD